MDCRGSVMPYISSNYQENPDAPFGKWVCTRDSDNGPYDKEPPLDTRKYPSFCGQCVSFVTTVCPTIPVAVDKWNNGRLVKGDNTVLKGTAIATFDKDGDYSGHAAIYESQNPVGLTVVDQWVTSPATAIHRRVLRFGAHGNSNNGDLFYVIE
jgi:hypothetical protein